MAILKNVHFYYCHVGTPILKYQKEAMEGFPMGNKEHVVDVLLPAKTFTGLKKKYKAGAPVKAFKEAKTYTAKEFEKAFKVPPPKGKEFINDDDEYTLMKFRCHAAYQDGEPTKTPPSIVGKSTTKDANGEKVGMNVAIGNGTMGGIQYKDETYTVPKSGAKGISLKLIRLQILDLVPYDANAKEFDMDDEDEDVDKGDEESFEVDEDDDSGADGTDEASDDSKEADDSWDE